jgi:hypothetical protein
VPTVTLDNLIAEHGSPRYCKTDVEGLEPAVLRGLSTAVPLLEFEYHRELLDHAEDRVELIGRLGTYVFNATSGEWPRLEFATWLPACEALEYVAGPDTIGWGNVVAHLGRDLRISSVRAVEVSLLSSGPARAVATTGGTAFPPVLVVIDGCALRDLAVEREH